MKVNYWPVGNRLIFELLESHWSVKQSIDQKERTDEMKNSSQNEANSSNKRLQNTHEVSLFSSFDGIRVQVCFCSGQNPQLFFKQTIQCLMNPTPTPL